MKWAEHSVTVLEWMMTGRTGFAMPPVFAFQFGPLNSAKAAIKIAQRRPNFSVYARDGAVISGVKGKWQPGLPPTEEWETIRRTFWKSETGANGEFLLGDFAKLARFFAQAQSIELRRETCVINIAGEPEEGSSVAVETNTGAGAGAVDA